MTPACAGGRPRGVDAAQGSTAEGSTAQGSVAQGRSGEWSGGWMKIARTGDVRHVRCRNCGGVHPRTDPDLQKAVPRQATSWPAAGVVVALLSSAYLIAAISWSLGGAGL